MNKDLTSLERNLSRNTGLQLGELLENWSEEFNDRSIVRLVRAVQYSSKIARMNLSLDAILL